MLCVLCAPRPVLVLGSNIYITIYNYVIYIAVYNNNINVLLNVDLATVDLAMAKNIGTLVKYEQRML